MNTNPTYNKHSLSLAAVFILGDSVIVLPYAASGKYTLLGFLIAAAAALIIYLALLPVTGCFIAKPEKSGIIIKTTACVLLIIAAVYAFWNAGRTFLHFIDYADKIMLPDGNKFVIAAIFVFLSAALAVKRKEVILKLSLIFFVFGALTVLLFFLLNAKDFRPENIAIYRFPPFKELIKETLPYFFGISLPAALLPVFNALFSNGSNKASSFFGLLTGLSLIALCLTDCLLLFGAELSERLEFPLAAAVSTVTVGPLFTRMDGVIYCLFFASALIKTAVCMKISYFSAERLKRLLLKKRRHSKKT